MIQPARELVRGQRKSSGAPEQDLGASDGSRRDCAGNKVAAQTGAAIPAAIRTPGRVETRFGPLEFKDRTPTLETVEKVRDTLDFTRALNVYNNSFRGASRGPAYVNK